jgi:hypothetical protein
MLASLWLAVVLATVAVFFASFLSWMVLGLHWADWRKVAKEAELRAALADHGLTPGSYMLPYPATKAEAATKEFAEKRKAGVAAMLTVFAPDAGMGKQLGLTFGLFLAVNATLAYLAGIGLKPGTDFVTVFRFVATAAVLAYLVGVVQYAVWFKIRVTGYAIESVAYGLVTGLIFAATWPAA